MSLRDQMLKAGLITEEQAKRSAHKQRVETKHTDRKERDQRREASKAEVERQQQAEREQNQRASRQQQEQEVAKQQALQVRQRELSALEQAYRDGAIPNWEGNRRYYYAAGGRIDWLMVSDDAGRRLEAGQAAICAGERNRARPVLLTAAAALKLRELDAARVWVLHAQ
jgi:uncharacterized protein